jgi:lipopolysaccharide/colanic/teichoic acid biosynthesis glycosyltransferase
MPVMKRVHARSAGHGRELPVGAQGKPVRAVELSIRRGMRSPACGGWTPPGSHASRAIKRTIDVIVAGTALVALAPLAALIAALIVLDSPGPIFHRAERVGYRGRPLRMLKFRKMRRDARGAALTTHGDPRLTRVGALLAATRLDELPQLWHVVRGEMSLVGPRPEHLGFVARHPSDYQRILSVRPGLAGLAQLAFADERAVLDARDPLGHYLTAILPQKVALDRIYASQCSVLQDMRIVLATVLVLTLRLPIAVHRRTGRLTLRRRQPQGSTVVEHA